MKNFKKIFIFIFFPFFSLFVVLLFINILVLDWSYAHKSQSTYQDPFDWFSYKVKINILKKINNFNNETEGLKRDELFVSYNAQKNLLNDAPYSTKIWQRGFFVTKDNEVKSIQIRHRGDNSANWMFEKKHWRIKSRKEDQFDRNRYFNYIPFDLNYYFSGIIANNIGVLSPKFDLVELYINQKSSGIYIKSERINENFLRRNRIMPVNIYKGEQILSEAVVGADNDLFGNNGVWSKVAIFNQVNPDDKSDLINFLNTLIKSENNPLEYKNLIEKVDLNKWAKFSAYQIITQNYHNDSYHNMRLVFDPWSGKVNPIILDPVIGDPIFTNELLNLEKSSHSLLRALNKNSYFINKKYNELLSLLVDKEIIENQIKFIKNLENKIIISNSRDVHRLFSTFNHINWKKSIYEKRIHNNSDREKIKVLSNNIKNHKLNILKFLYSKPDSSWFHNTNGFNINVNGHLPISNLKINFNGEVPKWISIDINKNKVIDENEKFFSNGNGNFNIPISLYSNRLTYAKNTNELLFPDIMTANTRFNFITEKSLKPNTITFNNPFSNKTYKLEYKKDIAVRSNKYNYPIVENFSHDIKTINFSGIVNVEDNLIIEKNTVIEPGTKFLIKKNKSIIFKKKVLANGTSKNPIVFMNKAKDHWGTVALQGNDTSGSKFNNVHLSGGSGAIINNIHYVSMFSLHDTTNIVLKNLEINNNARYDDAIHIVYCENVELDNIFVDKAFSDALDIDMSKDIKVTNSLFYNPGNDSIDVMESNVTIEYSEMYNSGDKGVSIGENSEVFIYNSFLNSNKIGVAVKDRSKTYIYYSDFIDNETHISSYQKNYQYGNGGKAEVSKSNFKDNDIYLNSDDKSIITIDDSSFNGSLNINNNQIILTENNSFDGNKNVINLYDQSLNKFINKDINKVKNINLRGSDFINK